MDLYKYDIKEQNVKEKIINELSIKMYYAKNNKKYLDIVFLCIGTDKIAGDCLGPLVGSRMKELFQNCNIVNINIYVTIY